jgi:hypothetical protein
MRGEEVEWGVVGETASIMGETDRKFIAMKVSMKCVLIFPV